MRKSPLLIVLTLVAIAAALTPSTRVGIVGAISAAVEVPFRARITPGQRLIHVVNVGMDDDRLWVRGSSGADIDCYLYDSDNDRVDEDTDDTDTCLLETPGLGTHRLVVRNRGSYSNTYVVRRE